MLGLCWALLLLKGRSWVFKEQKNNLWGKSEDNRESIIDRCIICCIKIFPTQNSDIKWESDGSQVRIFVSVLALLRPQGWGVEQKGLCIFFLTADERSES